MLFFFKVTGLLRLLVAALLAKTLIILSTFTGIVVNSCIVFNAFRSVLLYFYNLFRYISFGALDFMLFFKHF